MAWGFVKSDGTRGLQKFCGIMNSQKYKEILIETLFPYMFLGEKLQQDNAPCHISTETLTFFNENCVDFIENPSQSPDLNLIKNLWGYVRRSAQSKPEKS